MNAIKKTARITGLLYLAIFIIYPLATSVRATLVVPGNAAMTAQNIAANLPLFRWGMAGESVIFLIEIVMAGFLYVLLRPVSQSISLASALGRAAEGVVMAAANLFTSILTLVLVGGSSYLMVFNQEQQHALALLFQDANTYVILIWGLFFALHLVLLGWLVYRSGFLPKIPGILLALAGFGYFVQSFGVMLDPSLADVLETVVIVLAVPGELVFAMWLLIKGVDENKWHERTLEVKQVLV